MSGNPEFLESNAISGALQWIESALAGNLASAVAIIAIACFGMMLMSGRISKRRGVQLVFGCFIVFGAGPIAQGIVHTILGVDHGGRLEPAKMPPAILQSAPTSATLPADTYDPYAGAALPPRR